jgi:hypothetical protein
MSSQWFSMAMTRHGAPVATSTCLCTPLTPAKAARGKHGFIRRSYASLTLSSRSAITFFMLDVMAVNRAQS